MKPDGQSSQNAEAFGSGATGGAVAPLLPAHRTDLRGLDQTLRPFPSDATARRPGRRGGRGKTSFQFRHREGSEELTAERGMSQPTAHRMHLPVARPLFCTQFQFPGWGVPFSARFSAPAVRGIEAGKRPKWPGSAYPLDSSLFRLTVFCGRCRMADMKPIKNMGKTPDPNEFARKMLWHMAGLRSEVGHIHMRLAELFAIETDEPVEEVQQAWKKSCLDLQQQIYLESVKEVGLSPLKSQG